MKSKPYVSHKTILVISTGDVMVITFSNRLWKLLRFVCICRWFVYNYASIPVTMNIINKLIDFLNDEDPRSPNMASAILADMSKTVDGKSNSAVIYH